MAVTCGPAWDLSDEYDSLTGDTVKKDLDTAQQLIAQLTEQCKGIAVDGTSAQDVAALAELASLKRAASTILRNLATYANCELSVDGASGDARSLLARTRDMMSALAQAVDPLSVALRLAPDAVADAYLALVPEEAFMLRHDRKLRDFTLPLGEEQVIKAMAVNGHTAWGTLYNAIGSGLSVDVAGAKMGASQAAALLSGDDRGARVAAWEGLQAAWGAYGESVAAILNALAGWRLEENRRRGAAAARGVPFLAPSLHSNRMSRATLDAMMTAIKEAQPMAQRALKLQARAMGLKALHPADLSAPPPPPPQSADGNGAAPAAEPIPFDEAIELIAQAVASVDASVGDFVRMMAKRGWIDAREGAARVGGAYCTSFARSRNPRVYLSAYTGSAYWVSTLAHELGHAYHNWVLRDLTLTESSYPMNLAETASIFFETVVSDALLARARSPAERFRCLWGEAESAAAFLLNIPARFDFESALYEARSEGRVLAPADLSKMMEEAWGGRYGDALSQLDPLFWATKLHFSLSSAQFYNWPYSFGYLFSLGVVATRESQGDNFHAAYSALLRDTGRMTAEELVQKHLGVSIEEPEFWRGSIRIIAAKMDALDAVMDELKF
ncbi:oligoendopeptidase F [Tribonema minus]|uniref:Oligoendopeptidase F n=1 Tax=Tribonema minus TaxID=303371 RepID=A0A835ZGA8_9STRA|nr:oligoendopeptidase F [Tribonema minus]